MGRCQPIWLTVPGLCSSHEHESSVTFLFNYVDSESNQYFDVEQGQLSYRVRTEEASARGRPCVIPTDPDHSLSQMSIDSKFSHLDGA